MPRRLRSFAGVLAVLCALCVVGRGSARGQARPAPPSAEEALLSILPYRLQQADVPAGFALMDLDSGRTPAGLAFEAGDTLAQSLSLLTGLQALGFITGFEQVVGPKTTTPIRIFAYRVDLYGVDDQASYAFHQALAAPSTGARQADNPPLPLRLGDESGAVHLLSVTAEGDPYGQERIIWRRGRLIISAILEVYDGTESLDQAIPFAQSADRHAAAVGQPVPPAQAATPTTGGDTYSVIAMYALNNRLPPESVAPFGFRIQDPREVTNSDLVLAAADPHGAFDRFATRWKRVVAVQRTYDTLQGKTGDTLRVRLALSADAAGATAELLDPDRQPGDTLETFSLPAPLGDASRLYHQTYTGADGVPREAWRAVWTHGRVVIALSGSGPAGEFSAQEVSDFAAAYDAIFQRGALPDVLTTAAPSSAPSSAPSAPAPGSVPPSAPPGNTPKPHPRAHRRGRDWRAQRRLGWGASAVAG